MPFLPYPIFYALLLGFTIAVRWPTFDAGFYPTDESLYLAVGERLADGGVLYRDTWDNKPPLILWFYGLNVAIFGKAAVWAVRVWACLILTWAAAALFGLIDDFKFATGGGEAFAFLFAALFSCPWYAAELNSELFILPLGVTAVRRTARHCVDDKRTWENLFFAGVCCGAAFFSKYQGIHLTLAVLTALFVLSTPTSADIATFVGGFAVVAGGVLSVLYVSGAWAEFWDVAVAYNVDYLRLPGNPGDDPNGDSILEYVKIWGLPIIFALWGMWTFRASFYQLPIRQRKFGTLMMIWFVFAVLTLTIGRNYLHYFGFVLPPATFWALFFIFGKWRKNYPKIAAMAYASLWILPSAMLALYFVVSSPQRYRRFQNLFKQGGWAESLHRSLHPDSELVELRALVDRLRPYGVRCVLVTAFRPELYRFLELKPATKYTNFGIVYYKADWWNENAYRPFSSVETQADFYAQFYSHPPPLIIDTDGVWEKMLVKLPPEIENYRFVRVGRYSLYVHKDINIPADQFPFFDGANGG
jgi:hypothetical protein